MKSVRLPGEPTTIEAVAERVETIPPPWPGAPLNADLVRFGARLSELLSQETPDDLLNRLAEFRRSVELALERSSSAYQVLRQLEDSGLKDCARCSRELEARLAGNAHYIVLSKIAEAERLVSEATARG
jgi:hypothetical protein